MRAMYAFALLVLVSFALAAMESKRGPQTTNSLALAAIFAQWFFTAFAILQLGVGTLLAAASASGTVADERQRKTIEFLFATDLSNREIVLGKFAGVMTSSLALLMAALPVIALTQLFGAIPIDEVLRSTCVTISTMAFVAAGCLLVSTLSNRPREAVVRAFVVATFLLLGPLLFIFMMIYRPDLYRWFQPVHEFLMDANPLVYWVRSNWPSTAPFLPTLTGWDGVYRLVWNQSVMTAVLLGLAIWQVRAVHLKGANRIAAVAKKRSPKLSWRSFLRPSLDWLPPMLWKELFLQSTIRGMTRKGKLIAVLIDGGLMAFLAWYWIRSAVAKDDMARSGFAEAMSLISLGVAWVYILVCATRAATSMTVERESGHWESLLTTRLAGPEIVFGKTIGAVLSLRILLLHVLAFFGMAAWFFPDMTWHGLRMCGAILACSFVVSAIGVANSVRSTNSSRAVLSTLWISAIFAGLYLIPMAFAGWPQDRQLRATLQTASFVESLNWAAFDDGPRSFVWGFRANQSNWIGIAIQCGIGLAFMAYAAFRFDHWTGRSARRK
jgi:ABC-type transport system involved in multi-copper enzyme maturation permease subunit